MNDFSDPEHCWSGQTAVTLATLGENNDQWMKKKKKKQQPERIKDALLSLKMAPEWVININDCHHSDDFVLFWASSHPYISLQLMSLLVAHQAFRVNTASATLQVLQGKNACLHLPAGPARDSLTRASFGLLAAPANPALINKPANWINKQLFLIFFFLQPAGVQSKCVINYLSLL